MRYIVTGGAGFIGSHLVDKLANEGHEVIVIDDFSLGKEENIKHHQNNNNVTIHKRDINEDLNGIFQKGIDAVFHLAAIPRVQFSIKNPLQTHKANVNGTFNLLLMCKKYGVKRFIFSSSSSIYGDQDILPLKETMEPNPMSPYALHKLIGEHYCKLFHQIFNLETISLRYFNVFGPRIDPEGEYACLIPKFIKLIHQDTRPTIFGDGEQTRDFTFVSDVIEANILAAKTENKNCFGQAFNIGNSRNLSVNEITKTILDLSNKNIEPIHGPPVIEPKHTLADSTKAKEFFSWQPKVVFEDGLEKTHQFITN
ncbi:MAG: NAD-dependent epimerase/dehydratase family protein [Candidatus Woesearchaeota archaeon]